MLNFVGLTSVAAWLLFACPFAPAQSVLRICNKGDLDIGVMTLVNYHNPLQVLVGADGWVEDGWTMVKMHTCESVYEPPMDQPAYIGFLYKTNDGDIRTPANGGDHEAWIHEVDPFSLCVSLTPFNVTDRDVKNLQRCSGGRTISLPISLYFKPSATGDYTYTFSPLQSNSVSLTRSNLESHPSSNPTPELAVKPRIIVSNSMGKAQEPPMSSLAHLHSTPPISAYGSKVIVYWIKVKEFIASADANFEAPNFHSQPVDVQGTTWYKTDLRPAGWSNACLMGVPRGQPKELFCSTQFSTLDEGSSAYQQLWTALNDSSLQLRAGHFDAPLAKLIPAGSNGFYTAYTPHSSYIEEKLEINGNGKYDLTLIVQAPERTVRTPNTLNPSRQRK